MKTLYLHIGWRKTGSSAIQSYMTKTMKDGRLFDMVVPTIGLSSQRLVTGAQPIAHHGLAGFKHPAQWNRYWDEMREFVENDRAEKYFISSEVFSSSFGKNPEMIPELARKLEIFDKVIVIAWLRRQDHYMTSLRVQKAKHGGKGSVRKDFLKRYPNDGNYFKILSMIERHVKNCEIRPNLYSRSNDIIASFLKSIDQEVTSVEKPKAGSINSSVSAEMYKLQTVTNEIFSEKGFDNKASELLLVRAWDMLPAPMKGAPAIPMTREERKLALKHFEESNRKLCQKYGLDLSFFLPGDDVIDQEPDYNIPDTVSPALLDAIRAALKTIGPSGHKKEFKELTAVLDTLAA